MTEAAGVGRAFNDCRQLLAEAPVRHVRDAQNLDGILGLDPSRQPVSVQVPESVTESLLPLRCFLVLGSAFVPSWHGDSKQLLAVPRKTLLRLPGPMQDV